MLYDSCARNRFEGNSFVANLTPLVLVGRRTDTVFSGNYWSDAREPDLDGLRLFLADHPVANSIEGGGR